MVEVLLRIPAPGLRVDLFLPRHPALPEAMLEQMVVPEAPGELRATREVMVRRMQTAVVEAVAGMKQKTVGMEVRLEVVVAVVDAVPRSQEPAA